MIRHSVQLRDRMFLKAYESLSFVKNMGKNIGKNINKKLSGKCSQKHLHHANNLYRYTQDFFIKSILKNSRSNWLFDW